MKLADIVRNSLNYSLGELKQDRELAQQIQNVLAWHGLFQYKRDGVFGRLSNYMLHRFNALHQIPYKAGVALDPTVARALVQTHPNQTQQILKSTAAATFLEDLVLLMQVSGFKTFTEPRQVNIIYLRGTNPDFSLNPDYPDEFNDLALLIDFFNGTPRLLGKWVATAHPGRYYTDNPHPKGALHQNGQETAWRVGKHRGYEALQQVLPITVTRDANRDYLTQGDKSYRGVFGANIHGSRTSNFKTIARWSAGCLVTLGMPAHHRFMEIVKSDPRYRRDPQFMFTATVLDGHGLLKVGSFSKPLEPPRIDSEARSLAAVIFGEAHGGSEALKVAIGSTALNRHRISLSTQEADWWGNSLAEICLKPGQYRNVLYNSAPESLQQEWHSCEKIAQKMLSGIIADSIDGATYFVPPKVAKPYWVKDLKQTKKVDGYTFFR